MDRPHHVIPLSTPGAVGIKSFADHIAVVLHRDSGNIAVCSPDGTLRTFTPEYAELELLRNWAQHAMSEREKP